MIQDRIATVKAQKISSSYRESSYVEYPTDLPASSSYDSVCS